MVDPLAGVGTLLVEAALAWPRALLCGGDGNDEQLAKLSANVRAAGVDSRVSVVAWHAGHLALRSRCADVALLDLPFGLKHALSPAPSASSSSASALPCEDFDTHQADRKGTKRGREWLDASALFDNNPTSIGVSEVVEANTQMCKILSMQKEQEAGSAAMQLYTSVISELWRVLKPGGRLVVLVDDAHHSLLLGLLGAVGQAEAKAWHIVKQNRVMIGDIPALIIACIKPA